MSSTEFQEWVYFEELCPSLHDRLELGFARVLCCLANITREKRQKPFKIEDFLPDYRGEQQGKERRRPVRELKAKFVAWVAEHNEWVAKQVMKEKEKKDANTKHRRH